MTKTSKLKNHIAPKSRRLGQALKTKFGVTLKEFDNILEGDLQAAERVGDLARQGRLSSEISPKLAEAYTQIIQGTEAYNRATADILLQTGKSAIAIDKAQAATMLANSKYGHERKELAQQFALGRDAENARHRYSLNYAELKGYIDAHLTSVDNQAGMVEQSYRPEIKQLSADEQFDRRRLTEALDKGTKARYDLIPEKHYVTDGVTDGGVKGTLLRIKSALGF